MHSIYVALIFVSALKMRGPLFGVLCIAVMQAFPQSNPPSDESYRSSKRLN